VKTNPVLSIFDQIVELLETNHAYFRVVEHEPEGRAEVITQIRGNQPSQVQVGTVVAVMANPSEPNNPEKVRLLLR
jgi:Ala-tRNA(Pro) deacylase